MLVDATLRELEQQAATGDVEAQKRLDAARLRAGQAPSVDYIANVIKEAYTLRNKHLRSACERLALAFLEKHQKVAKRIFWDCGDGGTIYDHLAYWIMDGLQISLVDDYCDFEDPHFTQDNHHEFEGSTYLTHLRGDCNCLEYHYHNQTKKTCFHKDDVAELSGEQKTFFIAMLEDGIKLFETLNQIDWGGYYPDKHRFSFSLKSE